MTVTDLRSAPQTFTLRDNGFQLERFEVPQDIDWQNEQEVSGLRLHFENCPMARLV